MQFWPLFGVFAAVSFVFATITVFVVNNDIDDFFGKFLGTVFWSAVIDIIFIVAWFVTRFLLGV